MSMSRLFFAPFEPKWDQEAHELFRDYSYKDFQLKFMGISKEKMVAYLKSTLTKGSMQSLCLWDEDKLVGVTALQALPWMSEHFGLRMYAVPHLLAHSDGPLVHARMLRYVIEELSDVDFLDCRVAVDDVFSAHALEVCGFRYVGAEIYMGRRISDIQEPPPTHPDFEIGECRVHERDQVLEIVGETHIHNRFEYDPMIQTPAARSLYRKLVAKCFDEDNFNVLVARRGDQIHGFIISKIAPTFSRIVGQTAGSLDFIGVRPKVRIRGLGAALNNWALYDMAQKGASFAAVRTLASNYPALSTCYRTGFAVTSTSLHFHRWIRRPAQANSKARTWQGGLIKLGKRVIA